MWTQDLHFGTQSVRDLFFQFQLRTSRKSVGITETTDIDFLLNMMMYFVFSIQFYLDRVNSSNLRVVHIARSRPYNLLLLRETQQIK